MIIDEIDYLSHYGILRRSGRYPWGSGGDQMTRNQSFLDYVSGLKEEGLSEAEIAKGIDISVSDLRAVKSIARNEVRQANIAMAQRLANKGTSNVEIGRRMGIPESTVRSLLAPGAADAQNVLSSTANVLRMAVDANGYIDVGAGVEAHLGVSKERLKTSVAILLEEGYTVHDVRVRQVATGLDTDMKILAKPGVTQKEVWQNQDKIRVPFHHSEDGGRTYTGFLDPISVDPKRIKVVWAEDGGSEADGVIYVREGVPDISLGKARYAQVRVKVGDSHYLKGMAVYKPDMPKGVDLEFHTNKPRSSDKLAALKPLSDDPDLPFGAVVKQLVDNPGSPNAKPRSAMNLVNEQGGWVGWKDSISAQVLSKQPPSLADRQLKLAETKRRAEFDEIMALTNPAVKATLLAKFADQTDRAAVNMHAAAMPRQSWSVILPINSLKPNEVYAPNYKQGERVVLVRYPHGGIFEIPELVVNNKNREARDILGDAPDAIGIHHKTAGVLSGADFDGDFVLVIPNAKGDIRTKKPLDGLKGFDPVAAYPAYEGMPRMTAQQKGSQMGQVSNLITDMTIKGAPTVELAAAIRHSMVVIDAEKHNLNWRQSAIDNGIPNLKRKYQNGPTSGATTLISRARGDVRIPERKPRAMGEGGPIDTTTGAKMSTPTGRTYIDKAGNRKPHTTKVHKLAITDDARTLVSKENTKIEQVYAEHSNSLKRLADEARLEYTRQPSIRVSPSAKAAYKAEVETLNAKMLLAARNKPLERQAQVLANAAIKLKRQANPHMSPDQLKKVRTSELANARVRAGTDARSRQITLTDREWDAVQAGAISDTKLKELLLNADLDQLRALATPRVNRVMVPALQQRAERLLKAGVPRGDIAATLGVPLGTLNSALERSE